MPSLMHQAQKVNRVCLDRIVDVKWEWFGVSARETVRTDVVATFPLDHLPRLPGNSLAESAPQAL